VTAVPVVSATLTTRTYKEFGDDFPHDAERLTADPVFVVVDAAPDLNGSPVYAATWQCRTRPIGRAWSEWTPHPGTHSHGYLSEWERRQVVEWRATKVDVVVMSDGECGVRLDGWEHLEQPHTEMPCPMPGVRMGDAGVRLCEVCNGTRRVPLSVPDGVLSWIELTRP